MEARVVLLYTGLALLSIYCHGQEKSSSSPLHLALKISLNTRSLENCIDEPICDKVVCDEDEDLVRLLCPAKCGKCECEDDPSVNCTEILDDVCTTEYGFSICAKSCNLCDKHPEDHCVDQVFGLTCAEIPYPCDDVLGKIACPDFCGLCPGQSQRTTSGTNLTSTVSKSTTTMPPITIQTERTTIPTKSTPASAPTASLTATTTTAKPLTGPCALNACENGAACREDGFSFKCSCTSGFKGPFCSIAIVTTAPIITSKPDACADVNNPCFNGGTCRVDSNNYAVCDCTSNYLPPYCETPAVTSTTTALVQKLPKMQ